MAVGSGARRQRAHGLIGTLPGVGSPLRWLLGLLVALHVLAAVVVGVTTDWAEPGFTTGDSLQYKELTGNDGLPYRDYEVAFPPLTWAFVELVELPDDPATAGRLLVLTQLRGRPRGGGRPGLRLVAAQCRGLARADAPAVLGRMDLRPDRPALGGPRDRGLALARRRREAGGGAPRRPRRVRQGLARAHPARPVGRGSLPGAEGRDRSPRRGRARCGCSSEGSGASSRC